ncbi:hypothetical protein E8E13_002609 [Curvularia kusanoi]|uniref:Uncharacterized protein n=1 Tax=Curvularia kusanoi TaxID=90978 RepID=A0A9P4T4T5_CURKU|nr:hypothetical protein E8E13_002609 [Curvularia kusanoi]
MVTSTSAHLLLRGWIFTVTVNPPVSETPYSGVYESGFCTSEDELVIKLMLPTGALSVELDDFDVVQSSKLLLLPIWQLRCFVRGLIVQHMENEGETPTYSRLGFFQCSVGNDDYFDLQSIIREANGYTEKLLTAPLIRLV